MRSWLGEARKQLRMSHAVLKNVSVIGAGGIGCAIAHALRAGDVDITLVESDAEKVRWGKANGVGIDGQSCFPINMVSFEQWSPPTSSEDSLVVLCTKCYDNQLVLSRLCQETDIVPIQNGFDRQLIDRVNHEGIASFVSECHSGQTQTRITRKGELHLGRSGDRQAQMMHPMRAALAQVLSEHGSFDVLEVSDVRPFKYAKVMYNAAISPLAAVTGLDNSKLLTLGPARRLFFAFLRENYRILKAAGIELGKVGPFYPQTVNRILSVPFLARAMAVPFSASLRNTYCSMSGDIERGQTEIRNFNGHLIDLAGHEPCELNRRACNLVERMAAVRATPALRFLDEMASVASVSQPESEGGV